jgi:hypothetical protein
LKGDRERGKEKAGIELERPIDAELDDVRMRIVGLARAVGGIKRGADVGHLHTPAIFTLRAGQAEPPPMAQPADGRRLEPR